MPQSYKNHPKKEAKGSKNPPSILDLFWSKCDGNFVMKNDAQKLPSAVQKGAQKGTQNHPKSIQKSIPKKYAKNVSKKLGFSSRPILPIEAPV